ncbi:MULTISPECIES: hypothetical protein [unclassified Rubrivivax]|uniref:hypothetical protein n=1 Tax=unclassified Rubrivivax TaxID=2649762 RepID=UPI001E37E68D|nr:MULTISPECIES: hypothetical protein [unclassified Rubrivivax]MCC9598314.1 hypothetical protein [Rubrivivax sp. JA1055]MCC9645430.1 hypothetical protein [Rubrivivax sp. JA1029]
MQAHAGLPLRGRPKKLELHAGFLLTPEGDQKIVGQSYSGLMKKAGEAGFLKLCERLQSVPETQLLAPQGRARWVSLYERMVVMAGSIGAAGPETSKLLDIFRQLAEGKVPAPDVLEALSPWAVVRMSYEGWSDLPATRREVTEHWFVLERAALRATRSSDTSAGWAMAFATDATLRAYWTPEALERLREAESPFVDWAVLARFSALLDVLLSQIALIEVKSKEHAFGFAHLFAPVSSRAGPERCRPGGAFVDWLKQWAGAGSLEKLLPATEQDDAVGLSTLKEWSRGQQFPSVRAINALAEPLLRQRPELALSMPEGRTRYWAAARADAILRLAQRGWPLLSTLMGRDPSAGAWCRRRYPHWLEHWRSG